LPQGLAVDDIDALDPGSHGVHAHPYIDNTKVAILRERKSRYLRKPCPPLLLQEEGEFVVAQQVERGADGNREHHQNDVALYQVRRHESGQRANGLVVNT
jgi:hypothetical protein